MKISKFETEEEWEAARAGKVTGTVVKDLVPKRASKYKKAGFWKIVAHRLAIPEYDEMHAMNRGIELEPEALKAFEEEIKIKLNKDLVLWERDDNSLIAISPDAFTEDLKTAVEVKCLGSEKHIEALYTQEVPKDFEDQVMQYFVVNDKLEKLYLVFYDPRVTCKQLFWIEVERDQEAVEKRLEAENKELEDVDKVVSELTEF